jgi:hypothetical protein
VGERLLAGLRKAGLPQGTPKIRRLAAILVADVACYSRLIEMQSEDYIACRRGDDEFVGSPLSVVLLCYADLSPCSADLIPCSIA